MAKDKFISYLRVSTDKQGAAALVWKHNGWLS
jgi:hypothetical protein